MDSWIIVLGAAGLGQTLMLFIVLASSPAQVPSVGGLGLFLGSIGATLAADLIDHMGLVAAFTWVKPLLTAALALIGPSLWIYTRILTEREWRPTPRLALHGLPYALLAALMYSALLTAPAEEWPTVLDPELDQGRSANEVFLLTLVVAQIGSYLVAVVQRIRYCRARLTDEFSNLEHRTLAWMTLICALVGAVLIVWVLSWGISHRASNLLTTSGYVLAISLIGSQGLRQGNIFQKHPAKTTPPASNLLPAAPERLEDPAADSSKSSESPKYARAALPPERIQQLQQQLDTLMQLDKPYLDGDLTLPELAAQIGASPHQLSQFFNQHLGESFFDYINRHRIAAFQRSALLPVNQERLILDLALDCGFGSKSTFNAVFKRQVGMSPSAWRQNAAKLTDGSGQFQRRP
jgi:AraC-like DNA-binding protein